MKVFSAIILAISILGVSVFGFLGMQTIYDGTNAGCLANFAVGTTPCPLRDGMFAFALFHLNAFNDSAASAFAPVSLFLLSLLLAFAFAIISKESLSPAPQFSYTKPNHVFVPPPRIQEESWIALHEHSPSIFRSA